MAGRISTYPVRIDDAGEVVGYEIAVGARKAGGKDPLEYPFLWQQGRLYELGRLVVNGSGWVLEYVVGLNDRGQIVGIGSHGGRRRVFLQTPRA